MASPLQCPPFEFSGKYYLVSEKGGGCVRQTSFFEGKPVLNQGVGYSVFLGFGASFAVFTSFLVSYPSMCSYFDPLSYVVQAGKLTHCLTFHPMWIRCGWRSGMLGPVTPLNGSIQQEEVLRQGSLLVSLCLRLHGSFGCRILPARDWFTTG